MKSHHIIVALMMSLLLIACDSEEDTTVTYITLINETDTYLRGLQGFVGSDPTIRAQDFENIPPGGEVTVPFLMGCGLSWQLHVRLDGFFIFYNYSDYAETTVPCNQTTTCTVHADESFTCDK